MGVKFSTYESYKSVDLGWLTEIPSHWEIKKLKYLGEAIIGLTYSPDDVVGENEGTLVLRSSNIQHSRLTFDDNVFVSKSISEKLRTQKGDILICARNGSRALIGKNAQIDENSVGLSFGAFMSIFRSRYNNYLSKVFNSALFEYQSGSFLTATINQLTTGNLNSFEIPLPTEIEREKIANFLDHETAKIDTLIEQQQQLIQLLKEKRQAVISHAVTKGLNPDAPMKDSGVEWFEKIPFDWKAVKLKFLTRQIVDGAHFTPTYVDDGVPFLRVTDIQSKEIDKQNIKYIPENEHDELIKRCKPECGDLLLSKNGSIGIPKIVDWNWEFSIFVSLCLLKFTKQMDVRYAYYFFMSKEISEQISSQVKQSTVINLHLDKIENFVFTVPPLLEQQAIADYLDETLDRFDVQIAKAQELISLSHERRTALISAAVTGKIDVRKWQAPNN